MLKNVSLSSLLTQKFMGLADIGMIHYHMPVGVAPKVECVQMVSNTHHHAAAT